MKDGIELLSHFQNIKDKGGGKYTCDCPICNRAGHVYVSIGRDSAALYCQGCKADGKQLATAVGLRASDLFFRKLTKAVRYISRKKLIPEIVAPV